MINISLNIRIILISLIICCLIFKPYLGFAASYNPSIEVEKNSISIHVYDNYTFEILVEFSIKILDEIAVSLAGQIPIQYSESLQSIEIEEAHTIKADGTIAQVSANRIFTKESPATTAAPMYADVKQKLIVFPEVAVGSKIYVRYKLIQKTPYFPESFHYDISLAPHTKNYTEVLIDAPKNMQVQIDSRGFRALDHNASSGREKWRWVSKVTNVSPQEPMELNQFDIGNYLMVSSFNDYSELAAAFAGRWRNKTNITPEIKKLADELTNGEKDQKKQAQALYNWVCQNIRYVAVLLGTGGYVPHEASEVLLNKYGDCKDHAVLLEALLRAKGIESTPVLINTAKKFSMSRVASPAEFNHVITFIPRINMYLDSTSGYAPFGILPSDDIDKTVLLVYSGRLEHTMIPEQNLVSSVQYIRVLPNGEIEGKSDENVKGPLEVFRRQIMAMQSGKTDEELINSIFTKNQESGTGKIDRGEPKNLNKNFRVRTEYMLDVDHNLFDSGIFKIPIGRGTENNSIARYTNRKELIYPFYCDSVQFVDDYEINFPANIKITSIPPNVEENIGSFLYKSTYELKGNVLVVKRAYKSKPKSLACNQDAYRLKRRIAAIIQKDITFPVKFVFSH